MKKYLISLLFIIKAATGNSQKMYAVVKLTAPFSGISYTESHNKAEFRPSIAKINFSWGVDLIYTGKKFQHKLSVTEVPFGKYFKLINKFMFEPGGLGLLGFRKASMGEFTDHFIIGYSLQKEGTKTRKFILGSGIRFNYSAGLGISFGRSKAYWNQVYLMSGGGSAGNYTYYGYEAVHHRDGYGLYIMPSVGFDIVSKKKQKRKINFNLFYYQGIKDMAHYDIHYQYGYFNDPSKQVDVPKQVLRSRGTTFGFSLGVPISIKK